MFSAWYYHDYLVLLFDDSRLGQSTTLLPRCILKVHVVSPFTSLNVYLIKTTGISKGPQINIMTSRARHLFGFENTHIWDWEFQSIWVLRRQRAYVWECSRCDVGLTFNLIHIHNFINKNFVALLSNVKVFYILMFVLLRFLNEQFPI